MLDLDYMLWYSYFAVHKVTDPGVVVVRVISMAHHKKPYVVMTGDPVILY